MDPVELRRKNGMRVGTTTATGQLLKESVGLMECLDKVEDAIRHLAGAAGQWRRPTAESVVSPSASGAKVYAWGLAAGYKNTGLGGGAPDKAEAEVEVYPDGTRRNSHQQRRNGAEPDRRARRLHRRGAGLPFATVGVLVMDTDLTPDGGPTTASRQTFVSGNAARLAARSMRERMQAVLAEKFDVPPDVIAFHEGLAYVDEAAPGRRQAGQWRQRPADAKACRRPTPRSMSFAEAVKALIDEGRSPKLRYEYWAPKTQPLGTGGDMHFAFSYAVHAALVSVDVETGEVAVERVITAHDVGRAINPLSLTGQIEGGVVMGMGNALDRALRRGERRARGRSTWASTRCRASSTSPDMQNFVVEHATADGPYGAKGVGEISSIPISPAITNAIYQRRGRALPGAARSTRMRCCWPCKHGQP